MISMKMNIAMVTGESVPVVVSPKVQVEFERQYNCGIASAFSGDEMRMEYVYFLAWKAATHLHKTSKEFEDWLDDVDDIEMVEDDPTPLAPVP